MARPLRKLWISLLPALLAACGPFVITPSEPGDSKSEGRAGDRLSPEAAATPDGSPQDVYHPGTDVRATLGDGDGRFEPDGPGEVGTEVVGAKDDDSKPLVDNGCIDTDPENNYLTAGYVVYTDEDGFLVLLYDTCKIEGPGGMLKEVTCDGYHGPETMPAELESKYITCDCEAGECVEDSVVLCTEPEAEVYHPGGSVWTNETDKTHISVCKDEATVDWYYCNEDGTFYVDDNVCNDGSKCGDGMCGGFVCTDTEFPGDDLENLIAGSIFLYSPTTGETVLMTDSCSPDDKHVRAYKCPLHTGTNPKQIKNSIQQDADLLDCEEDKACTFGVCEEKEVPDPDPDPDPEPPCQDDDPENDIYFPGLLVLYTDAPTPLYFPDKCLWFYEQDMDNPGTMILNMKVHQYLCDLETGGKQSYLYDCNFNESCVAGACIKETDVGETCDFQCVDTDNGKDVLVGGKIYGESEVCGTSVDSNDRCVEDPSKIEEQFCDGDIFSEEELDCPAGSFCRGIGEPAKCVVCNDNDETDDPAAYGEVDDIDGVHITDFCTSEGQLKQAQCSPENGLAVWSDPENCPPGTSCLQGKCE